MCDGIVAVLCEPRMSRTRPCGHGAMPRPAALDAAVECGLVRSRERGPSDHARPIGPRHRRADARSNASCRVHRSSARGSLGLRHSLERTASSIEPRVRRLDPVERPPCANVSQGSVLLRGLGGAMRSRALCRKPLDVLARSRTAAVQARAGEPLPGTLRRRGARGRHRGTPQRGQDDALQRAHEGGRGDHRLRVPDGQVERRHGDDRRRPARAARGARRREEGDARRGPRAGRSRHRPGAARRPAPGRRAARRRRRLLAGSRSGERHRDS